MKAYLCQTEDGPQYIHLQADAKRIDKNYQTVEIDVAKGPLLDMLNDLMRRAYAGSTLEEPAVASRPAPLRPAEDEVGTFAVGNEPPAADRYAGDLYLVREGQKCNVCLTNKDIAAWRASSEASIEVSEVVSHITDKNHLDRLAELIALRKADLG